MDFADKFHDKLLEVLSGRKCEWFYDALLDKPACLIGSDVLHFERSRSSITTRYQNLEVHWMKGSEGWIKIDTALRNIRKVNDEVRTAAIRKAVAKSLLKRLSAL